MTGTEAILLIVGGLVAGTINTLAGGASSITVPLLVLIGLPGNVANGTNRVGILIQSLWAALRFRAAGVSGFRASVPILLPTCAGALVGAYLISAVSDRVFERLFAVVMVLMLIPIIGGSRHRALGPREPRRLSNATGFTVFFAIGVFGGAFQVGVGLLLLAALHYLGHDLLHANSIKMVVNTLLTAVAVPIFILRDQVEWLPAVCLTIGFVAGSSLGVRLAVNNGARVIRPAMAVAVVLLAGKMFGLY